MPGKSSLGRIARERGDPIWYWLLRNGPHGPSFKWASPLGSVEHLKRIVAERSEQDPEFPAKARSAALDALGYEDARIIRRGIHVLAVVGTDEDLLLVEELERHSDTAVAQDARSCLFERGVKPSRKERS